MMEVRKTRLKAGDCCAFCTKNKNHPTVGRIDCELGMNGKVEGKCKFFEKDKDKSRIFENFQDRFKNTVYEDEIDASEAYRLKGESMEKKREQLVDEINKDMYSSANAVRAEITFNTDICDLLQEVKTADDLDGLEKKYHELKRKKEEILYER